MLRSASTSDPTSRWPPSSPCSGAGRSCAGISIRSPSRARALKLVIGLTGGIGSGKSAAADAFAELGARVVDTDAIAHELTGTAGAAIPEIAREFGKAFIDASGAMDRKRMRDLV